MRGETLLFGGGLNGNLNRDVIIIRHPGVTSEEELVAQLRLDGIVPSSLESTASPASAVL